MQHIFVWTPTDVVIALFAAILFGCCAAVKILEWWESRK
jgi:hypothetical protein